MSYRNRIQYTGSQLTPKTYSVTLADNAQAATDGELFIALIEDDPRTASYLTCLGSVTGGTFTVLFPIDSSLSANAIPNFTNSIKISSIVGSELSERSGTGVVSLWGQSNIISWNDDFDATIDSVPETVNQWSRTNSRPIQFSEWLEHQQLSITTDRNTVSYATHFSRWLISQGYSGILNAPSGYDGVGFATTNGWSVGDAVYNTAVSDTSDAINYHPDNFPLCCVMRLGELDAQQPTTTQEYFRDKMIDLIQSARSEIQTNTGRDMSTWPFIMVGLNEEFLTGVNATKAALVEAAMAEVATIVPFTYHLSIAGWSTSRGDAIHDSGATCRRVGEFELPLALPLAKGNVSPDGAAAQIRASFTVDGDMTVAALQTGPAQITASFTADGNMTVSDFAGQAAQITATFTADGDMTVADLVDSGPSYPLTAATNPTGYYRGDDGVTKSGSQVTEVANLLGSGGNFINNTGTVTESAGRLVFDGTADLRLAAGLLDYTVTTGTVIWQFDSTAGVMFSEGDSTAYTTGITPADQWQMKPGFGTNLESLPAYDTRDGTLQRAAMTMDGTTVRFYHVVGANNLVEIHSEAQAAIQGGISPESFLGSRRGSDLCVGNLDWIYYKDDGALSLTEINNVASEG